MSNIGKLRAGLLVCALVVCLPGGGASAQEPADDQVAVWTVIERQWAAEGDGDDWIEDMLTSDFVGWPYESPAPRTRTSTEMWNDFSRNQWKPITHELYPLSIVVHGDTAIAHYLYSNSGELPDGKVVTRNGRFTDILVRDDGEWKFLSWHGGELPGK